MAAKKAEEVKEVQEEVKETPKSEKEYWNERVPFRAFRDSGKYKDDIFVGWNGKGYNIKRGIEVMVPRAVRDIIWNSMDQDDRTNAMIEAKQHEFAAESRRYE